MIRSKKIMSEVFPKLGELPQPVIDKMLEKANDGMLLYTPVQKIGEEKASMYYCLRCGSRKEIRLYNKCWGKQVEPTKKK